VEFLYCYAITDHYYPPQMKADSIVQTPDLDAAEVETRSYSFESRA